MFYAEQLVWNNANGTKSTGQNYTLNMTASSCQPNPPTKNNTSSSVMYAKKKLGNDFPEKKEFLFYFSLNLIWTNTNAPFNTITMR